MFVCNLISKVEESLSERLSCERKEPAKGVDEYRSWRRVRPSDMTGVVA